jgi:hypothetical protein
MHSRSLAEEQEVVRATVVAMTERLRSLRQDEVRSSRKRYLPAINRQTAIAVGLSLVAIFALRFGVTVVVDYLAADIEQEYVVGVTPRPLVRGSTVMASGVREYRLHRYEGLLDSVRTKLHVASPARVPLAFNSAPETADDQRSVKAAGLYLAAKASGISAVFNSQGIEVVDGRNVDVTLKQGDRLSSLAGQPVASVADIAAALELVPAGSESVDVVTSQGKHLKIAYDVDGTGVVRRLGLEFREIAPAVGGISGAHIQAIDSRVSASDGLAVFLTDYMAMVGASSKQTIVAIGRISTDGAVSRVANIEAMLPTVVSSRARVVIVADEDVKTARKILKRTGIRVVGGATVDEVLDTLDLKSGPPRNRP